MKRPADLRSIPLATVLPIRPGLGEMITMARDQWDGLLSAAYADGWVLLEMDEQDQPVKAYQREDAGASATTKGT